ASGDQHELLLSLNRDLLSSLARQEGLPNPSVHVALRLSSHHNLAYESQYLNRLKTELHSHIQRYRNARLRSAWARWSLTPSASPQLSLQQPGGDGAPGPLHPGAEVLLLRPEHRQLRRGRAQGSLLAHLRRQLEQEKEHLTFSHRPLTNFYQYSLGVLALCVNGVRVNNHVANKLIKAAQHERFKHGDVDSVDTYAVAGVALQCVKNAGFHVHGAAEWDAALAKIKQKLLAARGANGHIGNEFSTGQAVQALLAMGSPESEYTAAMEAMRTSVRCNFTTTPWPCLRFSQPCT
ncbi:unnamed protein product, partial [Tetraodon nigroviridis]